MLSPQGRRSLWLLLISGLILYGDMKTIPYSLSSTVAQNPSLIPPVLPPVLFADRGDQKAYLCWNPCPEAAFGKVRGYRVFQKRGKDWVAIATVGPNRTEWTATGLDNGKTYTFAVAALLHDGAETERSCSVEVKPTTLKPPTLQTEPVSLSFGPYRESISHGVVVHWADGQSIVFDEDIARWRDWQVADGQHLLYPIPYGNGIDMVKMDAQGFPTMPQKTKDHPWLGDAYTVDYTSPTRELGDRTFRGLVSYHIDGERVTFESWLPIEDTGWTRWTAIRVWQTFWPVQKKIGGTLYVGLARKIEVFVPSYFKWGYQICLNDGFGPEGVRKNVSLYYAHFHSAGIVDFSPSWDITQPMLAGTPRRGGGYHADLGCLQAVPMGFLDWGNGNLIFAVRQLYHCAHIQFASYPEEGHDGVWPNLAFDCGEAGRRFVVDTVYYLYSSPKISRDFPPVPQRYTDAQLHFLWRNAETFGFKPAFLTASVYTGTLDGQRLAKVGLLPFARELAKAWHRNSIDAFAFWHDFWLSQPYSVSSKYLRDPNYGANREIATLCKQLKEDGIQPVFWMRGELLTMSLPLALSDRFWGGDPRAEEYQQFPCGAPYLEQLGAKRVREHAMEWIRRNKDGEWPKDTPYGWVPMSMASGWFDDQLYPTLRMGRLLGFEGILVDGGFGGLEGVDYTPLIEGKTKEALPCQPYWWRFYRTAAWLGYRLWGECTTSWLGGFVAGAGIQHDMPDLWWLSVGNSYDRPSFVDEPAFEHRAFELAEMSPGGTLDRIGEDFLVALSEHRLPNWKDLPTPFRRELATAMGFLRKYGPPKRIVFVNLRPGEIKKCTTPSNWFTGSHNTSFTYRGWQWDGVEWVTQDGRHIAYPSTP
jgi:hypothetical protein